MPVPSFAVELCRGPASRRSGHAGAFQHATMCSPDEAVEAGFLDEITDMS